MQKILLLLTTIALMTTACQSKSIQEVNSTTKQNSAALADVASTNNEIADSVQNIAKEVSSLKALHTDQQNQCLVEVKNLIAANNTMRKDFQELNKLLHQKSAQPTTQKVSTNQAYTKITDGKMIFGESEWMFILEANASFDSRIDTGASISSISALDMVQFERDGAKWFSFSIPLDDKNSIKMEAPWVRDAKIVQSSTDGKAEVRPVVALTVRIGDLTEKAEFSLRNRTNMQYAVLIGREFIQDIAVVDVSRKHVQPKLDAKHSVGASKVTKTGKSIPNSRPVETKKEKAKEEVLAKPKAVPAENHEQTPAKAK